MSVEIQTMGEGGIFEIAAVVIDEVLEIQPFTDVEYEILSSARDILAAGSILEAATVATNSANTAAGLASGAASAANDAAGLANSATTSANTAAGAANTAASSANSAASAANTAAATAASFVGTGPAGYYATLTALQAAYPTGDTGIYVELEYGHWYYWSGSAWKDGGLFQTPLAVVQTTGTSETDVMSQKAVTSVISEINSAIVSQELIKYKDYGFVSKADGSVNPGYAGGAFTDYMPTKYVSKLETTDIRMGNVVQQSVFAFYNEDKTFLGYKNQYTVLKSEFPLGTEYYIYCSILDDYLLANYIPCAEYSYINIPYSKEDVIDTIESNFQRDNLIFIPDSFSLINGGTQNIYLPGMIEQSSKYGKNVLLTCNKEIVLSDIVNLKTFDISISFYKNNNLSESIKSSTINWITKSTVSLAQERAVLFIGDSLTAHEIYVNEFSRQLCGVGDAADINLIGGTLSPLSLPISVIGTSGNLSVKQEGRGGWNTTNFLTQSSLYGLANPFWNPTTSEFDIDYYLTNNNFYTSLGGEVNSTGSNFDVFIFLGWNGDRVYEHILDMVNRIKAKLTGVNIILVGMQTPLFDVLDATGADGFRKAMKQIIEDSLIKQRISEELNNVSFFPIAPYFNPINCYRMQYITPTIRDNTQITHCLDHVHPMEGQGYGQIADILVAQYLNYLTSV